MFKKIILALVLFLFFSINLKSMTYKDKILHLSDSAFMTVWATGFERNILSMNEDESLVIAANLTLVMGISKEISDKFVKKTEFSKADILFDIGGIALGIIIVKNMR